jgi:formylglycine-generating enzyme required for sulfatase activity
MTDIEQTGKLRNSESRLLRGGSFLNLAADVRSAICSPARPDIRGPYVGLRVGRTYP